MGFGRFICILSQTDLFKQNNLVGDVSYEGLQLYAKLRNIGRMSRYIILSLTVPSFVWYFKEW